MRATFDSRAVRPGMIFVALKGEKSDGHDYIPQARAAGASEIIDGYAALDRAARDRRRALKAVVIGVTGSAGKTTTKEFLRTFFSALGRTAATEGNFNNHIGLPMTILNCPDDADFLIVEMGTNHPGEIAHLCSIAEPDVGLITNIGTAHIGNFGSQAAIAREKGEILKAAKRFGIGPDEAAPLPPRLAAAVAAVLPGAHNQANAALAFAAAARFGLTEARAIAALKDFALPGARWRRVEQRGVHFIDDTYNANPDAMIAALDAFASMTCAGRKIAILGDMFELGERARELHEQVFAHAAACGLDAVIAVGETSSGCRADAAFRTVAELAAARADLLKPGDTVLLKASHGLHLGDILNETTST